MHLYYNGVELQIERTSEVSIEDVMDANGMDTLYQRVTISMNCVWQANATTSNIPGLGEPPNILLNPHLPGDRLGQAFFNLRQTLMTPQRPLKIWLAQDRTWDVPATLISNPAFNAVALSAQAPQAQGGLGPLGPNIRLQAACDPGGGPFPQHCRVLEITGDQTAIVSYKIVFHVTDSTRYVLSHRWRTTSHVGQDWLTTRVTEGRAAFRLDLMTFGGAVADQFRTNFAQAVPLGFIRKDVNVIATEDGKELYYRITDQQLGMNLGYDSAAIKVDGHVSTGATWPFKSVWEGMKSVKKVWDAIPNPFDLAWSPLKSSEALLEAGFAAMPQPRAMAVCRVTGGHGADQTKLATLAINIVTDRLAKSKIVGAFFPVSAFLMASVNSEGGPYVEVTIEALISGLSMISAIWNPQANLATHLNLASTVKDAGGKTIMNNNINWLNPPFPGSSGSRGTWLAAMVGQALTQDGVAVPSVPTGDALSGVSRVDTEFGLI